MAYEDFNAWERYPGRTEGRYEGFHAGSDRWQGMGLQRVSDLSGWHVQEGDPDIRGWNIVDQGGDTLGTVRDMIASTDTREVYFLIAQVGGMLGMGGKHVVVPLDRVRLDRDNSRVYLNASRDDLDGAPEWRADRATDYGEVYRYWQERRTSGFAQQRELAGVRGGEARAGRGEGIVDRAKDALGMGEQRSERDRGRAGTEERRIPLREEELGAQREERHGAVEVGKRVETEERSIDVPVTHTNVEVERRLVSGQGRRDVRGDIGEGEVRVPIIEEEVRVEKHPVVNEEIVVRPHRETKTERHTETIRREVPEVRREGGVDVNAKDDIDLK